MKITKINYLFLFVGIVFLASCQTKSQWNVTKFGAVADDKIVSTEAFQKAIDACSKAGGGTVLVPRGTFYGGTIELKSGVTLHFAEGAAYLGTQKQLDYKTDCEIAVEIPSSSTAQIYAVDASNIAVTGKGMVSVRGDAEFFPKTYKNDAGKKKYGIRPMNIRFIRCKNVRLEDVHITNSAAWNVHLVDCDKIKIKGIKIDGHVNVNNDGIDIDSCRDVLIEDCDLKVGDDAICPKGTLDSPTEDLIVRNCRVSSRWGCFKIGTSSRGGFKNIKVTDCYFYDCPGVPIKLLMVDGGVMENVLISDIKMERVSGPIFIRLGARNRDYKTTMEQVHSEDAKSEGEAVNIIKNITIKNIQADLTTTELESNTIFLTGIPNQDIENVVLENIQVSYPGGGKEEHCDIQIPEDIARYPEKRYFGIPPSWALYARHVSGLSITNLKCTLKGQDFRHAVFTEDVKKLHIDGLELSSQSGNADRLKLIDTPEPIINNIKEVVF